MSFYSYSFSLESSSEVAGVIDSVKGLGIDIPLFHIVSFIHNTVLVQSLKTQLLKSFPNTTVELIKHNDKTLSYLNLYIDNVKKFL